MGRPDHDLDEPTDVTTCRAHECDRPCAECFTDELDRQHDTSKECAP